jgi:hypothetical protein
MNWSKLAATLLSFIGAIAAMPYELGQVALLFPPAYKPWFAFGGFLAAAIIRSINSNEKPPTPPADLPPNR